VAKAAFVYMLPFCLCLDAVPAAHSLEVKDDSFLLSPNNRAAICSPAREAKLLTGRVIALLRAI
jgi:hypothetical protein